MHEEFAAVVFDLDGTLLDSERVICDAVSRAAARFGAKVAPAEVAPHLGAPLHELFEVFLREEPASSYKRFHLAYVEEHDAHEEKTPKVLPGVERALTELGRRGFPLAVATTKPTDRAAVQLHKTGLATHFKHIQGTDAPMVHKPAPDVVLAACAGLDVNASQVLMVGDTIRDVGAGKAADAETAVVAYSDGNHTRASTFGADHLLRSLEELLAFPTLAGR